MSYNSRVTYRATAGQQEFDLTFPFIHRDHVGVILNGHTSEKVFLTESRVRLPRPCEAEDAVIIFRETPIDEPIVQFQNGSVLTEEELNTSVEQLLYRAQEVTDLYNYSLGRGMVRVGNNLGVVTNPDAIVDEFVSMVLADALLDEFRQRISDIDLNAEQIVNQALQITNAQETINQQWAAQANAAAVVSTLQSNFNNLVGVVDGLVNIGDGEGIATLIANEANARVTADTAIASTLALIGAANGPRTAFNLNLNTVMANSTTTMAQRLNAISAQADANSRTIFAEEITATSNAISAQGAILSGLSANVAGNRADIINESNVRSNAVAAIAGTLALLGANAVGGSAFILDQNKVSVTPTETLGQRLSTISANAAGLASTINSEQTARIANGTALALQITGLGSRVDGANAAISAEQTTRASGDQAEANARIALAATISGQLSSANAAIAAESTARATANSAQTAAREAAVSQLQSGINSANAAISSEATTRADANSAQTAARTAMAATFTQGLNAANAAISSESSTRASADTALTNTFTLLGARNGPGTAFILNDSTVFVNSTTTLGTFMSGVDSRFGSASASVVNLTTALASANSVTASQISGLSASINGANASITNLSTIVSGSGGLTTRVGVVTDVNGYLTGWSLNNDGDSGEMAVLSDTFSIRSLGSGARTEYRDGVWYVYDPDNSTRSMNGKMFGGSDKLVLWVGPSSVTEGSETKANAYVYVSTIAPRFGGSDVVIAGSGGSGAKPLVGASGTTIASATVTSVVTGSFIEMTATFNVSFLSDDTPMYGDIIFEEGTGGTWTTIATAPVGIGGGSGLVLPDGSSPGGSATGSGSGFGSRTGSVTYRARFDYVTGSGIHGSVYEMDGSVKVTRPA